MLDPATARLCVWRLPLEAAFRLFSKLGSLGGSIRERFSRTGRTRPALARPAFSRWLLENDRLRERWPCQWLNVLYFPFSETSPLSTWKRCLCRSGRNCASLPSPEKSRRWGWPEPCRWWVCRSMVPTTEALPMPPTSPSYCPGAPNHDLSTGRKMSATTAPTLAAARVQRPPGEAHQGAFFSSD